MRLVGLCAAAGCGGGDCKGGHTRSGAINAYRAGRAEAKGG